MIFHAIPRCSQALVAIDWVDCYMIFHDIPWYSVVFQVPCGHWLSWFFMIFHDIPWYSVLSQGQPSLLSLCLHNDPRHSMESLKWASASSCQKVLLSKMSFWGKSHYLNWASASSLPKLRRQASHKVPIRHTSVILWAGFWVQRLFSENSAAPKRLLGTRPQKQIGVEAPI